MSIAEKIGNALSNAGASVKTLVKIALGSRPLKRITSPEASAGLPLVVLGNGPSLNDTIAEDRDALDRFPLLAVNFFATAEVFTELRPEYYVVADPHFFEPEPSGNVLRLRESLARVDWPMTLFIPASSRSLAGRLTAGNPSITVALFNMTAAEGFEALENIAFDTRLGMPRPRNVLIPSLMIAIWLGFKTIYVAGADHSWMQTLAVNDRNEVVSVQPHFYKEAPDEEARVTQVYRGVRLHDVVRSFYVAFKSYFTIRRYALRRGVRIINITPGSFIDAFERGRLP